MKSDTYENQQAYLRPKMSVGVAIALAGGGLFRGSAAIVKASGALLTIRISSEEVRANAGAGAGSLLTVGIETETGQHVSSALVTGTDGEDTMNVHLFGGFQPGELHQVFRLQASMKISYWLVTEMDPDEVEIDWDRRRHLEHIKFQGLGELALAAERARVRPPREIEWREMKRAEVSLGIDGINLKLPECVQPGQLVFLDLHLPLEPPRQINIVAQVLAVKAPVSSGKRVSQEVGMSFVLLDDKDRDLILKHITVAQRDRRPTGNDEDDAAVLEQMAAATPLKQRSVLTPVLTVVGLLILAFLAVNFLKNRESTQSGEIQKTYEKSIKRYRHLDE